MKLSFIPKCEEDFLSVLYVLAFDSAHKYYHHPFLLQKKKKKKDWEGAWVVVKWTDRGMVTIT